MSDDRTEGSDSANEVPLPTRLTNMLLGPWLARPIYVAAEMGVADHLADGPKRVEELAALIGSHGPSLYRLLRYLASVGIFHETGPDVFGQTALSALLRSDGPDSMRDGVLMMGDDWHWQAWGALGYSVRTGQPAVEHLFGESLFQYFAHQNPEAGRRFTRAFAGVADAALVEAYDFSQFETVVDVGGGGGSLLRAIVAANPSVRGVLFDRPEVIERVRAEAGLHERIELVAGDFFQAVPKADGYVLRNIVHDWNDEQARSILRNCREAMKPGGTVLVVELIVPPGVEWSYSKLLDLEMLVCTSGRERTEEEFRALFEAAGLRLTGVVPTEFTSVIEGLPS